MLAKKTQKSRLASGLVPVTQKGGVHSPVATCLFMFKFNLIF